MDFELISLLCGGLFYISSLRVVLTLSVARKKKIPRQQKKKLK